MVDLVKGVNAFVVAGSANNTASRSLHVILDKGITFPFVIVNKNGRVPVRKHWVVSRNKNYSARDNRGYEYLPQNQIIVMCASEEERELKNKFAPSMLFMAGDRIVENAYLFSSEEKLDKAIALQEYLKTPEAIAHDEANAEEYEHWLAVSKANRTYRW